MKSVNFPEHNKTYTAPKGQTKEDCNDLQVYEAENVKISCWEATSEEMLHFIFFRKIWLNVQLNIQPPVYLSPEFPFYEHADGKEREPIEAILEKMIERKVKLFLVKKLRETENLEEISIIESDWLKQFMIDYTNFFAGIDINENANINN